MHTKKNLTILMLGLMLNLAACQSLSPPKTLRPSLPPKPTLEQSELGGRDYVCYDKENAAKLRRYIIDLQTEIIRAGEL